MFELAGLDEAARPLPPISVPEKLPPLLPSSTSERSEIGTTVVAAAARSSTRSWFESPARRGQRDVQRGSVPVLPGASVSATTGVTESAAPKLWVVQLPVDRAR